MGKFTYFQYETLAVVRKNIIEVEADTKEEADAKIARNADNDFIFAERPEDGVEYIESELMYDEGDAERMDREDEIPVVEVVDAETWETVAKFR